jgi:hypothetical protein
MKFFIDTEFIESGPCFPLILLSVGIVSEDGREFYAVNADAPLELANDWVKANVVPHLLKIDLVGEPRMKIATLKHAVLAFIGDCKPEFWGYYADYDWVVFCQLFGKMMDLPKGWPMYCRDIKQLCDERNNPELPKQHSTEHNALNDARWNKKAYEFLIAEAYHLALSQNLLCDQPEAVTLQQHTQYVEQFLNDMYATMIDPVEQPKMKVAEMCELLLKTAREQRESYHVAAWQPNVLEALEELVRCIGHRWCDLCGKMPDSLHSEYCPVPKAEAVILKVRSEGAAASPQDREK